MLKVIKKVSFIILSILTVLLGLLVILVSSELVFNKSYIQTQHALGSSTAILQLRIFFVFGIIISALGIIMLVSKIRKLLKSIN